MRHGHRRQADEIRRCAPGARGGDGNSGHTQGDERGAGATDAEASGKGRGSSGCRTNLEWMTKLNQRHAAGSWVEQWARLRQREAEAVQLVLVLEVVLQVEVVGR